MIRRAVALACALVLGLPVLLITAAPRAALAQGAPQIQVQTDATTVGVGDLVHVQATASSSDNMPSDPQLGATPGFVLRGQNASPSQTHIVVNGSRSDRYSLTVDWVLQAQQVGTHVVGPPTFSIGGARQAGAKVTLHVVPAGQAPARRGRPSGLPPPFGGTPFDPWRGLFPDLAPAPEPEAPIVATDPKLALDAPRDPAYFLHATVSKTSAVIGEQVTFDVYEYVDISVPLADAKEDHDPAAADFVKHSLLRDDQQQPVLGFAAVGGKTWRVRLVRRWALFPLHAGDLEIGPMQATISVVGQRAALRRQSERLRVHVTDAPLAGRPPGFASGDVGTFNLGAQVDPRTATQGGAVAVHIELAGTGNVPSALSVPTQEGVEWLAPETHDDLGARGHEQYGGKRTFDYVVRLNRGGDVDLGAVSLPYYDPDQKKYAVARAPLGTVHVAPSASAPAPAASAETLAGLPAVRPALEHAPRDRPHLDDSPWFWILAIGGSPLAFGLAVAGRFTGTRLARALRDRRTSPEAELRERIAGARAASGGQDPRAVDAAVVRVVESAAIARRGVNLRGALRSEVEARLTAAGVDVETARGIAELLRDCEAARFAPDADAGEGAGGMQAARERWSKAEALVRGLQRTG